MDRPSRRSDRRPAARSRTRTRADRSGGGRRTRGRHPGGLTARDWIAFACSAGSARRLAAAAWCGRADTGTPRHNTASPSAQIQQSPTTNPQVTALPPRSNPECGRSQVTRLGVAPLSQGLRPPAVTAFVAIFMCRSHVSYGSGSDGNCRSPLQ